MTKTEPMFLKGNWHAEQPSALWAKDNATDLLVNVYQAKHSSLHVPQDATRSGDWVSSNNHLSRRTVHVQKGLAKVGHLAEPD